VLRELAEAQPDLAPIHAALGDTLRRAEMCEEAIDSYTAALDRVDTGQQRYWFLFYTRAICYHLTDNWPPAEADFRKALELNPEQPQVLNYLGYSLVEQRRNLDEALDMIERAAARGPIPDTSSTLAWVYYRLGRFDEAVEPMERAAELLPTDPIINDHLGTSTGWSGDRGEARFQWERALEPRPGRRGRRPYPPEARCRARCRARRRRRRRRIPVRYFAPAKVNLALHVTGRRDDGYHLLDSLVVFAGVGDWLEIEARRTALSVTGPRAEGVPTDRSNLVWRAAEAFGGARGANDHPGKTPAARGGIGGGSADAGAALRGLVDYGALPDPRA
jgi:tetratricopeptide (TPR) repeat protein